MENKLTTFRFTRVPFGNSSSPFILNATVVHLVSLSPISRARQELLTNTYVDDLVSGADTVDEAISLMEDATRIMEQGSFRLTKWKSNCRMVTQNKGSIHTTSVKILGTLWSPESDVFSFNNEIEICGKISKRSILAAFSSIYDPLGLLSPYVFLAKTLFQQVWRGATTWDEELPAELASAFRRWAGSSSYLKEIQMSRP